MNGRRRAGIVAAAIVVVVGIAVLVGEAWVAPTLQIALSTAATTGGIALAAVAGSRYTRERDPHALFVAVAGAVVGVQGIVAIWTGTRDTTVSVTAWLSGWAVAGVLTLLAVPWRDRRGRQPVRPGVVAGLTALAVIVADVTIVVAVEADRLGARADTAAGEAGPEAAAFGMIAIATLAIAGVRELRSSTAAPHVDLGVAWILGVFVPLAQLQAATFGGDLARYADAVPILVLAIAAGGFLRAERTEATRMRRASDRAEEVLGGRAEIASMIAHEVRGPVSTIKGLAATTSGSYDKLSDEERREFVGLIQDEASRLLDVVDQTSLALRIDAGTLTFERRPHDLAAVARDAIGAASIAGHEVTAELDETLTATVDRRWLAIAVRQGVDNAARFSPPGAPIDVALRRRGNAAVIEVADRGPGVPAERRDEVFGRFARWRPPGYEDRQGSGLGLFICRGILAEHAGDASLDARPEGGTMLRLTIPLDEPPPMEG